MLNLCKLSLRTLSLLLSLMLNQLSLLLSLS